MFWHYNCGDCPRCREALILSVDQISTILEKKEAGESWVSRTSIHELTESDFAEVEKLFSNITKITGVNNPLGPGPVNGFEIQSKDGILHLVR
jgi:hypothetical protein